MIYIACPYTDPKPHIRTERARIAGYYGHTLAQEGIFFFSPLTHGHYIDVNWPITNPDYWIKWCKKFVPICHTLHILDIEGREDSKGVSREIEWFRQAEKPIHLIECNYWEYAEISLSSKCESDVVFRTLGSPT